MADESQPDIGPVITGMMMLCDAAQSVGGKLYILGGAWSQMQRPPGVTALAVTVAVKLSVPWDLANHRVMMTLRLLDDEGNPVDLGEGPVQAEGQLEVARGLGLRQGTPLVSTFVIPFGSRSESGQICV